MITAGFDIGTRFIKACIVEDEKLLGYAMGDPGNNISRSIAAMYRNVLDAAGVKKKGRAHCSDRVRIGPGEEGRLDHARGDMYRARHSHYQP